MAHVGIFFFRGGCCFFSILKAGGPLGLDLLKRKPCEFVGSLWGNIAYHFFYKINFSDFHCLFNPSWYQMGRGGKESFNFLKCFFVLVKMSSCGKLKKKTNKAVLTIVINTKQVLVQKQDWELTVAQIMNSLLPNSDLN